jgi:predicted transposase/invertase (TIGR01784 family)
MTTERDLKNQFAYVREEGRQEGRQEERYANASKLKALGVDVAIISQATGLSEEKINLL